VMVVMVSLSSTPRPRTNHNAHGCAIQLLSSRSLTFLTLDEVLLLPQGFGSASGLVSLRLVHCQFRAVGDKSQTTNPPPRSADKSKNAKLRALTNCFAIDNDGASWSDPGRQLRGARPACRSAATSNAAQPLHRLRAFGCLEQDLPHSRCQQSQNIYVVSNWAPNCMRLLQSLFFMDLSSACWLKRCFC
jgi:hypothetical protein